MTRRTVVAMLWFVSASFAGEVLWSIGATPRPVGLIVAAAIAGFVWLDPARQFHPRADALSSDAPTHHPTEVQLLPR